MGLHALAMQWQVPAMWLLCAYLTYLPLCGNFTLSFGRCCLSFIHLAISGGHLPYSGCHLKATFITTWSLLKQFLSLSIFCFALHVLVTLFLLQILFWQLLVSVFGNCWWYGKSYICLLRVFSTCCYVIKLDEEVALSTFYVRCAYFTVTHWITLREIRTRQEPTSCRPLCI